MTNLQTNYQSLSPCHEDTDSVQEHDVIFHVAPESGKSRWNHIEDLDSFFRKVYNYHQRHGLACIITSDFYDLVLMIFLVGIATVAANCVDYGYFARQRFQNVTYVEKVKFSDLIYPASVCVRRIGNFSWLCVGIGCLCSLLKFGKLFYNTFSYYEIKLFYKNVLKISPEDLENVTWYDIQCKLQEVQRELQMCVHKQDLTELDIYHRILRHNNYMVAMVNKDIISVKYRFPIIGEMVYFSTGLLYNLQFLFFWSPFSPFKSTWQLKDDYKKFQKRKELADRFSKTVFLLGVVNLVLCPVIIMWQLIYSFFSYAGLFRKEPGALGTRGWSQYAKLYLRHFNELDHELKSRLNRAYKSACYYMDSFSSPLLACHAYNINRTCGFIAGLLFLWTVFEEEVLQVDHIILIISFATFIWYASRTVIPDENQVFLPEALMTKILSDIHYMPDNWRGKAHTRAVKDDFGQLFQVKFVTILVELFSPVITPFILMFSIRHRALDIVDFFRNFTVDVVGVGDVCSFALMDVDRHGNHNWCDEDFTKADQYQQAENGKTELSLMHFLTTNPDWKPPHASNMFVNHLKEQANLDESNQYTSPIDNPLITSLNSLQLCGGRYGNLLNSMVRSVSGKPPSVSSMHFSRMAAGIHQAPVLSGSGLTRSEGPPFLTDSALLSSLHRGSNDDELCCTHFGQDMLNPLEYRAAELSLNTLYLHELHHRNVLKSRHFTRHLSRIPQEAVNDEETAAGDENCPLLEFKIEP